MVSLFAQELKKARGDETMDAFAKGLGVKPGTYSTWERGTYIPSDETVTHVADWLGWDDELRLACMKPLSKEFSDLHIALWEHLRFLRLTHQEAGLIMNLGKHTVKSWRYGIPKVHEEVVRDFLAMDEQEAYEILMKKEGVI